MPALTERMRRRGTECASVASSLPAYVAGETGLDPTSAVHLGQCLRCQADVARYRRMLRTLHALRQETEDPPAGVLSEIITRLDGSGRSRWDGIGDLWGAVAVAMIAGALGAAGVLVWSARRRDPAGPSLRLG